MDESNRLLQEAVTHEAAHAVVSYVVGFTPKALEVWVRGPVGGQWRVGGQTGAPIPKTPGSGPIHNRICEGEIMISLAGHALESNRAGRTAPFTRADWANLSLEDWQMCKHWLRLMTPPLSPSQRARCMAEQWAAVRAFLSVHYQSVVRVADVVLAECAQQCGKRFGPVEVALPRDVLAPLFRSDPNLQLSRQAWRAQSVFAGTRGKVTAEVVEVDAYAYQRCSITERGIKVDSVSFQTQIGAGPISEFMAPTRGPGDASVVRGGILGPGEYECDVQLDSSRQSWIMPRLILENGETMSLGPFGFDRDKKPNLHFVDVLDTVIRVLGDVDTKSIRIFDKLGTWVYETDGLSSGPVDVTFTGTNGVAGMSLSGSSIFTVEARSDPTVDVDGETLIDSRDVVVTGPSGTPAAADWDGPAGVQVLGPASLGDDEARIILKATGAPVGWTVALTATIGPGFGDVTSDITAEVSPALSAPPTSSTTYTWPSGYERFAGGGLGAQYITLSVKADLVDGSSNVVATRTVQASWYSAS